MTGRRGRSGRLDRRRRRAGIAAIAAVLAVIGGAAPAAAELDEFALRAAFLFNFVRFVEWPAELLPPQAPVRLCVMGEDPFAGTLEALVAGETVGGHAFEVAHVPGAEEARDCHLIYVSEQSTPEEVAALFELDLDALTVGETESLLRRGGLIRFYRDGSRLRFEVNGPALAKSRLNFSSKLLRLAVMVNP